MHFFSSPLALHATCTLNNKQIVGIALSARSKPGVSLEVVGEDPNGSLEKQISEWITCYIRKEPAKQALPLLWPPMGSFTRRALEIVQEISFGSTLTYGEIARLLGKPKSARAIGNACGANPFLLCIPCHRVVGAGNKLGGFRAGLEIKSQLLAHE